jgi:hypothetical protein
MRYAILSDVHGRRRKLEAVLEDALQRGAEEIISLGDVGGDDCLSLLCQADAKAVFGNYEVSGWERLAPKHRDWVRAWPPILVEEGFVAVHAAPWYPVGLENVDDFAAWLRSTGRSWRALFPYLSDDDDYLWQALAELEMADRAILFHGHTHLQAVWRQSPAGYLRQVRPATIDIKPDHHYVVGVGSVGLPEDGGWAAYMLYDTDSAQIEPVRLQHAV